MGVIRAEPARVTDWAARSVGAAWRAFDLQLVVYAALLVAIGLVMAYTNSVENGSTPLEAGTTFTRGLMWAGIAAIVFVLTTMFDYRWLKTLSWPTYALQLGLLVLTLAIGDGVGNSARWITLGPLTFQFSELAKILMIIVLANYLAGRSQRLDSIRTILGACVLVAPPLALVMLQPDLGTSLVFAAILIGMLWMSGASMKWLATMAAAVIAMVPIAWTYLLRDYQKERLTSFLNPKPDITDSGYQLYQSQIAVGSGGWFGRGLTNGTQAQGDFLPGAVDRLRLLGPRRRARVHRRDRAFPALHRCCCGASSWPAGDPETRSGPCSQPGSRRWSCSSCSSTSGWSWASCRSPGSHCPSSRTVALRWSASRSASGILQSINIRQTRAEW